MNTKTTTKFSKKITIVLLFFTMTTFCIGQTNPTTNPQNPGIIISDSQELKKRDYGVPEISKNKLVIRYKNNPSESRKSELRKIYRVKNATECKCGNSNIELWEFESKAEIEQIVSNQQEKDDTEVEIDHEFTYYASKSYNSQNSVKDISEYIIREGNKNRINVAVIDTGIDLGSFEKPFLYDSSKTGILPTQQSGWNFINNTPNVQDDHGHGTAVTKIIASNLNDIEYSILPVKAFDYNGKTSYWSLVCALEYLNNFPDIHIINGSFGYEKLKNKGTFKTILKETDIIQQLIDDLKNQAIYVASAGNKCKNTDSNRGKHYPSGFKNSNILTVGGTKLSKCIFRKNKIVKHRKSNYGIISIDLAAPFTFNILGKAQHGTSFSTAYITSKCAQLLHKQPSVYKTKRGSEVIFNSELLKKEVFKNAKESSNLRKCFKEAKYYQ